MTDENIRDESFENSSTDGIDENTIHYEEETAIPKSEQDEKETVEAQSDFDTIVIDDFSENSDSQQQIPTERKPKKFGKFILYGLIFGIVAGFVTGITSTAVKTLISSKIAIRSTENIISKSEDSASVESAIADIAEECMPSVVSITNKGVTEIMTFFGTYQQESMSSGSGIIIGKNDTELLIVTNYHVISDSQELSVIFTDSENPVLNGDNMQEDLSKVLSDSEDVVQAQVKGYDSDKDLAVVSVKLDSISANVLGKIKVATVGDSSKIRAGEQVIAIGNALGYGQSVTTGIVSATDRLVTLESQTSNTTVTNKFIQTDAAINPGNSGGALLNMRGELIGINSVKIASSGVEGMGYAIPISDVEEIIGELMTRQTREVVDEDKQGFLGITIQDVTSQISNSYGMPVGVFVSTVSEGSAANKAGLKKGYIITAFDGYTVKTGAELQDRLTYYKAGEKTTITVQIPNGTEYEEKELNITLDSKKERTKIMEKEEQERQRDNKE